MDEFSLGIDTLRSRRNKKWSFLPPDVLPAWIADADFAPAPAVQKAINRLVGDGDYGYPWREPARGETVPAAFARWVAEMFGWQVDPARVQPVADVVQAAYAAILAFTEPGDAIAVQVPAYPPLRQAIIATGRRLIENPMVDDGSRYVVDLDHLRSAAADARMLLFCSPQNPTGRVFDRGELEAVGRWAIERDLVVFSDEIHFDIVYPGYRHMPLAAVAPEIAARTVTATSATKSFNIPALRCGVVHFGSAELQARFQARVPPPFLGAVSIVGADATVAAWTEGRPWFEGVLAQLLARRDRIAEVLSRELPEIRHYSPEGTFLAWLDCSGLGLATSPGQFFQEEAKVGLVDGRHFGSQYPHFVRLNFATSQEVLDQILDRMAGAVRRRARATCGAGPVLRDLARAGPSRSSRMFVDIGGAMSTQNQAKVSGANVLTGTGRPGVFESNFDFQLSRLMAATVWSGAALGECLVTARRVPDRDLDAWVREWSALAGRVEGQARQAEQGGFTVSARDAYLRAFSYYRTSQFYLPHRNAQKRELWQQSRDAFQRAAKLFDPPVEPVAIPYDGITLCGYFVHAEKGSGPRPTLLVLGGGDTTAEELYSHGFGAARRGFNAVLFDGPGQGGTAQLYPDVPYRFDWEKPVAAVVDYALSRPQVDPERLALSGSSFGGYLAPRAAAFEKRLRACVIRMLIPDSRARVMQHFGGDPIPADIDSRLDMSNPNFHLSLYDFLPRLGGTKPTVAELASILRDYNLWGLEDKLTCALLVIMTSGEGERQIATARQFFDKIASKQKKFVLLTAEDGADAHCAANNPARSHQETFDWLQEVLDVHPRS